VKIVSEGEAIEVTKHLVPGKFTVVDYSADWCVPCKILAHDLDRLLTERDDVAVRIVDLIDWESAAAEQAVEDYGITGIPYVRVYGPTGLFLGAVDSNDIAAVRALLRR
jgi:thiol-disulfide isomerase/thioredoxin